MLRKVAANFRVTKLSNKRFFKTILTKVAASRKATMLSIQYEIFINETEQCWVLLRSAEKF